ncbi:3036_t:CDS:2, partial [Ambispora leptoticha]
MFQRNQASDSLVRLQIIQDYGLDPNVYAGQSLDDSVIPDPSFANDFYASGDASGFGEGPVYSVIPKDNSWLVDSPSAQAHEQSPSQDQQQRTLHDSPVQEHVRLPNDPAASLTFQNNDNDINNIEQIPNRAQTPTPLKNIPHYLTARRRSLSADNIHAIAKAHAPFVDENNYPKQENGQDYIYMQRGGEAGGIPGSHTMLLDDAHVINSTGDLHHHQSLNIASRARMFNSPSTNHVQKFNEGQARFKVKLPRNIPNIQVPNPAIAINPTGALPASMNLTAFPGVIPVPRRGHMRKRSLSAPTQPFANPQLSVGGNGMPSLQPAPSFPFNISSVSPSFRRPGALPIQIQRSHKHSHASAPMSSEEYQRKLDEELEKIDFEDITVSELKDMLRQRGKPATAYPRRFSPYGSVSIPNSPRMIPYGMGNTRAISNYNNGGFAFPEGVDEWHFKSAGIVRHGSQQLVEMENNAMFQMKQPTTSAATTNEFAAFQQSPSSAPPLRTEFVNNTYEFMRSNQLSTMELPIGINEEMMRMEISDDATAGSNPSASATTADTIMVKQESDDPAKELGTQSFGLQTLGFEFEQDDQIFQQPLDLQMQLEPQDEMFF